MVDRYRYEFKLSMADMVSDIVYNAIGRRPDGYSLKTSNTKFSLIFNEPDLTPAERQAIRDAMPEYILKLYDVTRTIETVNDQP